MFYRNRFEIPFYFIKEKKKILVCAELAEVHFSFSTEHIKAIIPCNFKLLKKTLFRETIKNLHLLPKEHEIQCNTGYEK